MIAALSAGEWWLAIGAFCFGGLIGVVLMAIVIAAGDE